MAKFKVAVIVGSLRKDSHNLKLAKALAKLGRDKFDAHIVQISDLPLYNADIENPLPAPVARMKKDIESADAVLFITPEYNRGLPGAMKNVIDWGSRPSGKSSWAGKPGAICGTSPGVLGTVSAQRDLRATLSHLDVITMNKPEVYVQFKEGLIDAEGNISVEDTKQFLQKFVDNFASWIERQTASQPKAQAA